MQTVLAQHPAQEKLPQDRCLSTVNQQYLLSEHSPQHWFQPQKNQTLCFPIITGTGPGEARRGGKTLRSFRSGSFRMCLSPHTKKATRCGELPVNALSFSPVPREIMGELSSFSLKSLGSSKSNLLPRSHNKTNTCNGTGMRALVGCMKGGLRNETDLDSNPSSTP